MQKIKFSNVKGFFSFLESKEIKYIGFGMLMLILFETFPCFVNGVSNFIMSLGIPIFIILCFLLIFLKYSSSKSIPIVSFPKESGQVDQNKEKSEHNEEHQEVEQPRVVSIQMNKINKLFSPIKFIAFVFFYLNLCSVGYYYAYPVFFKDKTITLTINDLNRANAFLTYPRFSQKTLIDSINHIYSRPVFYAFPAVSKFFLDTIPGHWDYHAIFLKNTPQGKNYVSVSNLKLHIFNFTKCKVDEFCTCDSANICLKNNYVEMYYMLALAKDKVKDTVYFARFLPK